MAGDCTGHVAAPDGGEGMRKDGLFEAWLLALISTRHAAWIGT